MMKRMWINQPSTLQRHHDLHGKKVLADMSSQENMVIVYFITGETEWTYVERSALSPGWSPATGSTASPLVRDHSWSRKKANREWEWEMAREWEWEMAALARQDGDLVAAAEHAMKARELGSL